MPTQLETFARLCVYSEISYNLVPFLFFLQGPGGGVRDGGSLRQRCP